MKRRRASLRLSQRAAADLAGISPTTWGLFEKHHKPIADLTRAGICRALRWTPDSIDRILAGLDPVADDDAPEPPTIASLADAIERLTDALGAIRGRVAALERPPPG